MLCTYICTYMHVCMTPIPLTYLYIYDLICTYNFSMANEVLELLPRTIAVMEKTKKVCEEKVVILIHCVNDDTDIL